MLKKILAVVICAVGIVIMLFTGLKLFDMAKGYRQGSDFYSDISTLAKNPGAGESIDPLKPEPDESEIELQAKRATEIQPENTHEVQSETVDESLLMLTRPFDLDFDALYTVNPDVVGWIYCENTPIDYPIVQTDDNDYYLYHMINGEYNSSGSIFLDSRCASDFSDQVNIVYGHNMKNSAMFGVIPNYKNQDYYEKHPEMWLLTPQKSYCIQLICGYEVSHDCLIYNIPDVKQEPEAWLPLLSQYTSSFYSGLEFKPDDQIIVLSTCTYTFEESRYILIGKLIKSE